MYMIFFLILNNLFVLQIENNISVFTMHKPYKFHNQDIQFVKTLISTMGVIYKLEKT